MPFRVPRELFCPKAMERAASVGERRASPAGFDRRGTHEEDGPVTREALIRPAGGPACGESVRISGRRGVRERTSRRAKSVRPEVGRRRGKTGAEAETDEGVGGPHRSEEVGKPGAAREPAEQRRPVWL